MSYCKSCGKRVQWAKHHRTNSWMIFDVALGRAEENELRWIIDLRKRGFMPDVSIARQAKVGELGVVDHHATCSKVDDWRPKKRGVTTS